MPVRVVWAYFRALDMGRAIDALTTARGIGLALGSEDTAQRRVEETLNAAYPQPRGALSDG